MERIATMNWYSALDASMQTFMPVYPFKDVSLIAPGQLSRINFVNPLIPMLCAVLLVCSRSFDFWWEFKGALRSPAASSWCQQNFFFKNHKTHRPSNSKPQTQTRCRNK